MVWLLYSIATGFYVKMTQVSLLLLLWLLLLMTTTIKQTIKQSAHSPTTVNTHSLGAAAASGHPSQGVRLVSGHA